MSSIRLRSYAKINWTLDVLHRRDDGYHELRTIYQTVSLHDSISITATGGAIEVTCQDPRVPSGETNLAHKAARLLAEAVRPASGARVEIEKRIPVAAGLGGGSSNAAATLLGLARLWRAEVDEATLIGIAARLGSDVPFFLVGGTALGVGRGEEVYPLEQVRPLDMLLVNPGFTVSTAFAYAKVSRLTSPDSPRIIPFTLLAAGGASELPLVASNDLEQVVIAAHPEIAELKRMLLDLGAQRALMTGSGATVYALFEKPDASERALSHMRALGYWSERVETIDRRQYLDTIFEGQ